jgi:predicted porin
MFKHGQIKDSFLQIENNAQELEISATYDIGRLIGLQIVLKQNKIKQRQTNKARNSADRMLLYF